MTIKLIAIDMDGTLLTPDHKISAGVKAAITAAKARGIHIVLNTGRPYSGVRPYLEELSIQGEADFCITYNGALLQKAASGEVLHSRALNYHDYRQLEALSRTLDCHFHVLDSQNLYTANHRISRYTVYESSLTQVPLIFCEPQNMPADIQLLKMMLIDDPHIINQAQARLPPALSSQYTVIRSTDYFIEFTHPAASKGQALRALAEKLNIAPAQIMAIGDQQNDADMLQYAGVPVAMGNAVAPIKALARHITKSNSQDGVAWAIEQWT